MESPILHFLQRFEWQFFLSLTFRQEWIVTKSAGRVRLAMFHSLEREVRRVFEVRPSDSAWALRQELGERTGRLHFHGLLLGQPSWALTERPGSIS